MKKYSNITELVGNTPIVRLNKLSGPNDAKIWGKLEYFNPAGSIKDRPALNMIETAEKQGLLKPGSTLVEPTSGNTGIALAFIAAQKGYKMVLVMPETVTNERKQLLKAYGAEIVLVKPDAGPGMTGAIGRANELVAEKGYVMLQQFKNAANPQVHESTTGPEIISAFPEGLDYFVAGIGTGGTITGTGKVLKEHWPGIRIYAVEPAGSAVLSGNSPGKHAIQGIGAGFVPDILDSEIFDDIVQVEDAEAKTMARRTATEEGILLGISSGAAIAAAVRVAKGKGSDKNLLVILPDTGERYLSTDLFDY